VWKRCISRRSPTPQIFGTSYMRAYSTRNDYQILHGDQTRCDEKFSGSNSNADARSLFTVANLLITNVFVYATIDGTGLSRNKENKTEQWNTAAWHKGCKH